MYETHKIIVQQFDDKYKIEYAECIFDLCNKIEVTINKILDYESNPSLFKDMSDKKESTMDKFDLKTAVSLIPVMDGNEETTEKIISSIELYDSYLQKPECKTLLISFILKTRLSKSAKLKLKTEYTTCSNLVNDMKLYLLTRKSSNALLTKLNSISQNEMSVTQFAGKIEELFVDLTISQANSNDKAYEVLRPINEQLAIKKFADGLRNRRLSTIIAARDYENFKDAVRAAQDEELAQPSTSSIFNMRGRYFADLRGRSFRGRSFRSQAQWSNRYGNPPRFQGKFNDNYNSYRDNRNPQTFYNSRSRFMRSTSNRSRVARSRGNHNVFTTRQNDPIETNEHISSEQKQFFRD